MQFPERLENTPFTSLARESSYSSFFSAWCTDFKNVIFEKIHSATSEVVEVERSFSRSLRPNFGFHLVLTGFDLEFSSFWVSRSFDLSDLGDLRRGSVNFFKNYIFEISASSWEKWAIARPCGQNFHLICPQRRCVPFCKSRLTCVLWFRGRGQVNTSWKLLSHCQIMLW